MAMFFLPPVFSEGHFRKITVPGQKQETTAQNDENNPTYSPEN